MNDMIYQQKEGKPKIQLLMVTEAYIIAMILKIIFNGIDF